MYLLKIVLIQLISKSLGEKHISFDSFIESYETIDVSNYAKSIGLTYFDLVFNDFKIKYKKNYTEDEEKRKYYFMITLIAIEKNKQQLQNGEVHHELAINKFADLLPEEKLQMGNNWSKCETQSFTQQVYMSDHIAEIDRTHSLPGYVDWRLKHVVTGVKNQGMCGSCWAFAGIATIESAYAIENNLTNKQLISLSEQEMMDCVSGDRYHCDGCNGGNVYEVYAYAQNNGAVKENDYPYKQKRISCKSIRTMWKTKISHFFELMPNVSDIDIMHIIYSKGPVAVIINAGDEDFRSYSNGIIITPGNQTIINNPTNHYITVVGWGTENGIDYWIIKNSFGSDWGENGYFRLKRGINSRGFNFLVLYQTFQQLKVQTTQQTTTMQEPNDSMKVKYSLIFNLSLLALILS